MAKLVLGIIAVVLLQVAFFRYMATERSESAKLRDVVPSPSLSRESSRVNEVPAVVTAAEPVTKIEKESSLSNAALPSRAPVRPQPVARERKVNLARRDTPATAHRERMTTFAVSEPPRRALPPKAMTGGYTVTLVDYPRSSAENTPKGSVKKKKRSFISRTLPALVKKPWSWMKSLASKLH